MKEMTKPAPAPRPIRYVSPVKVKPREIAWKKKILYTPASKTRIEPSNYAYEWFHRWIKKVG